MTAVNLDELAHAALIVDDGEGSAKALVARDTGNRRRRIKIERQRCRQFARFQWQKSGASAAAEAEAARIASIRQALQPLRLMQLWQRAVTIEVPTERLERAMVDENAKAAVIALILEAAGKRARPWPWLSPIVFRSCH